MPKVLNKRTDTIPPDAVYVGRPSKWGNPFLVRHGSRGKVIALYADWLDGMVFNERLNIDELRGKDLVCWCAPLPCHADILLKLANC
ncbi:hypothetical protein LCGC14_2084930 [marine sediment metagenome]|uniref:DUF4326 domain-containing protein n=1 Tax=marine sediment metagenome TaxID=412755 RepID=A0A0F9EER1_9ZZZZ